MAFHHPAHGKPQVIQGNFQGRQPAFTAQAKPAFPQAAQRRRAPHGQAAQPWAAQPNRIGNAFQVPEAVNLSRPGHGRALPNAVREQMESFFSADFSDVRIHVGAQAKSIGAVAFTMGSEIHFAPGHYNPNTSHGQRLLGHELTHVVQQRAGRVRNPFGTGVAVVQDPAMEAEADRMGMGAAAHRVPVEAKRAVQQKPSPAHGGRSPAAHVQAVVAQTKTAQPQTQARPLTMGGPPEVIQGKFPNGFSQIVRFHQQAETIQPKMAGSAIQLAPALGPFRPSSGGRPLPVLVQRKMEKLFGMRFNDVRIHEGPEASSIGALAFTRGSHLYFAPGQYNPTTAQGRQLLGHELTHVVQQRSGRVGHPFGGGVAVVQDPAMEAEAERMGMRAAMYGVPVQAKRAAFVPATRTLPHVIQRSKKELRALSFLAKGFARAEGLEVQEFQTMKIGTLAYIISANSQHSTARLAVGLKKATRLDIGTKMEQMLNVKIGNKNKKQKAREWIKKQKELEGVEQEIEAWVSRSQRWKEKVEKDSEKWKKKAEGQYVVEAKSAESCARQLLRGEQFIILQGSGLHAEQNLLLALAHLLNKAKLSKTSVEIYGVKKPCGKCLPVLKAFAVAFKDVYKCKLKYWGEMGMENKHKDKIAQLNLKEHFPNASGTFKKFVNKYHEVFDG